MVAALLDALQIDVLNLLVQLVPLKSVGSCKVSSHINQDSVHIPGIDVLRGAGLGSDLGAAVGAEALGEGAHNALIAAASVFTDGPLVLVGDAGLEDHLLGHGFIVLSLGQIALTEHLAEDAQLAVAVTAGAVPFLAPVFVDTGGIGVKHGGVIGDGDQAGALGHRQALELLAEVLGCGALDTVAASAQIDPVQVFLHDGILVVFPFKDLGTEDLHDLTLNGDALLIRHIFDQLLGDGGAAELGIAAEEHVHAGLYGGDPVHALVLIKPFVLNGHGGIDQRLGNLLQGSHLAVGGGEDLLQLLDVACSVQIVDKGGFVHAVVVNGPVGRFRQDVILQIVTQGTHEHHAADQHDQHHRGGSTNGDLQQGQSHTADHIRNLQQPVGIPLLPELFHSPGFLVFIFHGIYLQTPRQPPQASVKS